MARRMILAIDPGRTTGLALVCASPPGKRPLLLGAWTTTGSTYRARFTRCAHAIAAAYAIAGEEWQVACESSPPVRRRTNGARGAGGDKYGIATAEGMGRYAGAAMALAWSLSPKHEPRLVKQRAWPQALRLVPGKRGDGTHRIREARSLLEMGQGVTLCSVDAAEAALIGAAVAMGVV